MLVPGYGTGTVNILRLWRARAGRESFDLGLFNAGRYAEAVEAQMRSENLTKVLYPSDSTRGRPGAAAQAAVFPGLLLAAGHHPPVPQQRLGGVPRQGRHPAQRHPPGAGDSRAHAPVGRVADAIRLHRTLTRYPLPPDLAPAREMDRTRTLAEPQADVEPVAPTQALRPRRSVARREASIRTCARPE